MRKSECYFAKFVSARSLCFLICWGVLLSLIFSLCPSNVFAADFFTAPNSDIRLVEFSHNIQEGCYFEDYDLVNGVKFRGGGSLQNSTRACGWSMTNGHLIQASQDAGAPYKWRAWKNYNNGNLYQDTNNYHGSFSTQDSPVDLGPMMTGYTLRLLRTSNTVNFDMPYSPDGTNSSYVSFVYAYSYNSAIRLNAFPPVVDTSYYHIRILDTNNNDISEYVNAQTGLTYLEEELDEINSTVNQFCTVPNMATSDSDGDLPSIIDDDTLAYLNDTYGNSDTTCFLFFAIPLHFNFKVSLTDGFIQFKTPNPNVSWTYKKWTSPFTQEEFDTPTIATTPLGYADGFFYGKIKNTNSQWSPISPTLSVYIPETAEEVAQINARIGKAKQLNSGITTSTPASLTAGSAYYMNWFNIFSFGFTYPLTSFFTSFTDSTSCVNLPIIGSMLNNPNVRYCSWFSNDIRSILTPVISLFSIILITGFVVHWLSGSRHITMNGGTE